MKIQEQIIDKLNGTQCWKIYFELYNHRPLTFLEWELINNNINKMIYEFDNIKSGDFATIKTENKGGNK